VLFENDALSISYHNVSWHLSSGRKFSEMAKNEDDEKQTKKKKPIIIFYINILFGNLFDWLFMTLFNEHDDDDDDA